MQETWLAFILVLQTLLLLGLWALLFQIVKQQGRLLLRLDRLEANSGQGDGGGAEAPAMPSGLAVGTAIASFTLADLSGNPASLEGYRGRKVLLVHWSPTCGYCDLIAEDLAKLHPELKKRGVDLVLASYGDAEANRKFAEQHKLECPVLLIGDKPFEVFQNFGTPVAYLVDEQGQVERPVAIGAEQVPALARELAHGKPVKLRLPGERPLSESTIEREGLKPGTPAPSFTLPAASGGEVSLESYRGRKVLLVLSDPHCGPCEQLAPHLNELHHQHRDNSLAVILVERGDPEETRRLADLHHFEFPVVTQKRWEISKEFGIFTTPVAFLINESGVVERPVAKGVEEILALARDAQAHGQASQTAS